jgi:DNA-binding SARP family transcriptional activator
VNKSLQINVLGGFQAVSPGGEPVAFSSRKGQALLGYLAVENDRQHSRESLASLLWGRTGDDRARHNLRQAIARIRAELVDIIAGEGDCVALDQHACETDVTRFAALAACTDTDSLSEALTLYRGDLLEGVTPREETFADWLPVARLRLRQLACKVADDLADKLIAAGKTDAAMQALGTLLDMEPAHERAHRRLMELLMLGNRRSEALRQYQQCVEALKRELGVEPDAGTQALCRKLRGDESAAGSGEKDTSTRTGIAEVSSAPAVAVLPFDNLSGEDDRYFADGIAEDLITALSCFHSLVVIARGSSFNYRDKGVPDKVIARDLGAQYLVRGSVRRADKRVRISVQLVDAEAGLQVWGHRYDREMEDVFVLQDEITSTLVSTLVGRVEAARLNYARRAEPERLDAYDLLLRGKDYHHRFTAEDCEMCIDMFSRAIDRDPEFAVAHAWLACGIGQAMVFRPDDISTLVDRSQAAAEKGLELDENESECHRILAQVQLTRRNLDRALWYQDRALFLNPNDDRIVCAQGELLSFVGRAEEAEEWVRKSMRLNPYHPERYWTHLVRALYHQGRFDEALQALGNISRLRKDDLAYRVAAAEMTGGAEQSVAPVEALLEQFPDFDATEFIQGSAYTDDEYREALLQPLIRAVGRVNR